MAHDGFQFSAGQLVYVTSGNFRVHSRPRPIYSTFESDGRRFYTVMGADGLPRWIEEKHIALYVASFNFNEAIQRAKNRMCVKRKDWDRDRYLYASIDGYFREHTPMGEDLVAVFSLADIEATDWVQA